MSMATVAPASPARRGLAFLAGVGFAAVPTVGPYVALLALASGGLQIHRADRWWWLAAVLLGLPWVLTGAFWAGVGTTAQVLAVWLIYRAAAEVRRGFQGTNLPHDVGLGLLAGFAGAMALGLERATTWRGEAARSVIEVFYWTANPALFGHAMLLLAALLAVVVPSIVLRVVALAMGAVAVIVSGSHEAVLAWLLIAVGLRFVGRRGGRASSVAEWALIAVMLAVASGVTSMVGLGQTGFRLDVIAPPSGSNLFRATEAPVGEWWYPLGVEVEVETVMVADQARVGYRVTKTDVQPYVRLQQIVELKPDTTYVLAVAWAADAGLRPGLDGWGRVGTSNRVANLGATYRDGAWLASSTGPITVLASTVEALDGHWNRGHVVFHYGGNEPIVWFVGAVPDRSNAIGVATTFAEFQLIEGDAWQPYAPNTAEVRLADLRTTRLPLWRQAAEAIAARPWLGWGPGGYVAAQGVLSPEDVRYRPVVAHAHSLLLDVWTERGAIGLAGLLLLAGVMSLRVLQQRDRAMAVVLGGVLLLNLFDTTLLTGALIYPLGAVLGWRAVGRREPAHAETGAGSAAAVRLALAATDVVVATTALAAGLALTGASVSAAFTGAWTPTLAYATLLWPAFAWAAGNYPGYGRALRDEFAGAVRTSLTASVTLGFAVLVLPAALPIDATAVALAAVVAVFLAPIARLLTKQGLRVARLWGRPVAILGTGTAAARVTRHLLDHGGIGLHPVAAFGDTAWEVTDLPVTGSLDRVWDYVRTYRVQHLIVAPEAADRIGFDEVLQRAERAVRFVQFVPDLHGIPASSVTATPLGTTLGLEVRNQLASGANRAVKRVVDLLGSTVLLVALGPALLLIAAWVRRDSKGPALYLAPRVGRYGRTFGCVKFRSMHVDAEARLQQLLAQDDRLRDEYERFHKLENDPRVTRAGRLLRKLSIDEFPQLINVFLGQMSLVGPRPYLVRELDEMGTERDLVFLARPGMTGYWQTEGRNDVTFEERQAMEAAYVRNWSVWWDVEILLRTPIVLLSRTGK
jgi:Undecaprenyl-phosphate galactose phosphotransferase WbaP